MKRLFSVLMAVVMLVSVISSVNMSAFADEPKSSITAQEYTAVCTNDNCTLSVKPSVTMVQTEVNYLKQTISIENVAELLSAGVTAVKVKAEMNYNGVITRSAEAQIILEEGKTDYEFTYPTYGKFTTTLTFVKGSEAVCTVSTVVGLIAEEYNIAPLNATFPVTYFSLALQEISVADDNTTPVPTFVALERAAAYNWDKLPENVFAVPYATMEQTKTGFSEFFNLVDAMAAYVKDLHALCEESFFNLYNVDNYNEFYLMMLTANGIDEEHSHVYILSDGSGSYSIFNRVFNVEDPQAKYDEMAEEWHRVKEEVRKAGKFEESMLKKYHSNMRDETRAYQIFEQYPYVIAKEEANTEWWLARVSDTLSLTAPTDGGAFLAAAKAESNGGCIVLKAMNTMLSALQAKGEKATNDFKALYNFSDAMFSEAEAQHKKAMVILGTRTELEYNFADYVKLVKAYYGDEYVYYYKGHPGTPTGLDSNKQALLNSLGLTDVESAIAAEVIMFFYPDIYLSGYSSTTFISAQPDKSCALFNINKDTAYTSGGVVGYASYVQKFISKVDLTNDYYKQYAPYCKAADKTYYLIEYNNNSDYYATVYNATDDVFTNLKYNVAAVYKYSVVNNGTVIDSGEANSVSLPVLESTATQTFEGWSDGTKMYPGGISVVLSGDTVFTAVWTDIAVPKKVTSVTTTAKTSTSLTLSWKKQADATKYEVYKYDSKSKKYKLYKTVTTNSVKVTKLTSTTNYKFKVRAVNASGNGAYSSVYSDYTKAKTPTIKSTESSKKKKLTVKWAKVSGVTGYQVKWSQKSDFSGSKTVTVKGASSLSKTVTTAKSNHKYYVKVRAYKTVDGKKIYSSWSKTKTIKVK